MKKALQFLRKNPEIIFFICVFLSWTAFMCNENAKEGGDFSWHDLKVEANGMIFDLFVFGILVTAYNAFRARKEKIERLKEEIDDYRGWNEKEAMYRIVGAIKRLNNEGVTNIDLRNCFLSEANLPIRFDLSGVSFTEADFSEALNSLETFLRKNVPRGKTWQLNLNEAKFYKANLSGAILTGSILTMAEFMGANLSGADLMDADLSGAHLMDTDLSGAELNGANFSRANLTRAKLSGASVPIDWFKKLEQWDVIGREEIIEKYLLDENRKLQLK